LSHNKPALKSLEREKVIYYNNNEQEVFMKKFLFVLPALMLFNINLHSGSNELRNINPSEIEKTNLPQPNPSPALQTGEPAVEIALYKTDETFSFESGARGAMQERLAAFKRAGVRTLGGRVVEAGNDYSFVIEYLPRVKKDSPLPPPILIKTYKNGAAYWRKSEAENERKFCEFKFKNARLPVITSYIYEIERDYGFAVDYTVKNVLGWAREYRAEIRKYVTGKFTFESQAERALPAIISLVERAGLPVLRGKAVERPDGDWAVETEYVTKTNKYKERPLYSVRRYSSPEEYPFEDRALKAGKERVAVFERAQLAAVSVIVRETPRDYSFDIDYLVKNIYSYNSVKPSATVATYQSPETFDFESQARKAMEEKARYLEEAGFPVLSKRIRESGRDYTYSIDYIIKDAPWAGEIQIYKSPGTFKFRSRAQEAMERKASAFTEAGFAVLSARVIKEGNEYRYIIEYLPDNGR